MRKIKKGDNVVVITGRDKGKRGDVARIVDAEHVVVNGINTVEAPHAAEPAQEPAGRDRREGAADPRLERGDLEPGHAEGGPRRLPDARRRPEGALLQVERRADRGVRRRRWPA